MSVRWLVGSCLKGQEVTLSMLLSEHLFLLSAGHGSRHGSGQRRLRPLLLGQPRVGQLAGNLVRPLQAVSRRRGLAGQLSKDKSLTS